MIFNFTFLLLKSHHYRKLRVFFPRTSLFSFFFLASLFCSIYFFCVCSVRIFLGSVASIFSFPLVVNKKMACIVSANGLLMTMTYYSRLSHDIPKYCAHEQCLSFEVFFCTYLLVCFHT